MTLDDFIRKWERADLTERQAAQEHFIDLCRLLNHPTPAEADPTGETYCFEKGVLKATGNPGWADVWKKGFFAFEYKKRKKNLKEAQDQLARYAWHLESPPIHVVCDTNLIRVITAFNNSPSRTFDIALPDLRKHEQRAILEAVFHAPERLRGHRTREMLTEEAADAFSAISERLQSRVADKEAVAHFVNQLVFCFFAEDVRLLPEGLFKKKLLRRAASQPEKAKEYLDGLFSAMEREGGEYALEPVAYFNGGLFDGRRAFALDADEIAILLRAAELDWGEIDPSIFGTLFERFLDPDKRKQIGAHYTDSEKILMLIEPVLVRPLVREWEATKAEIEGLLAGTIKPPRRARGRGSLSPKAAAEEARARFTQRLSTLSILDPACGSGNFLYLALQSVKDIELRANTECEEFGLPVQQPMVGPEILHGIEINPLAAELARTTIWIGHIQWGIRNSFYTPPRPILRKLDSIQRRDALIEIAQDGTVREAQWPKAEFIVGNPPFLGGKLMRTRLQDDAYVDTLFQVFDGRVPPEADLVTYWFAKTHEEIAKGVVRRAGLVATNSIRGGANRRVLDRIADEGRIFEAWSDEPWVVDGAAVRVSLICFGAADDPALLDGKPASRINSDLTAGAQDFTKARRLDENLGVAFMGDTKGGAFDVPGELARGWLQLPVNPNGRPNADVLRPWRNGMDITRRSKDKWIIDFGWEMSEREASLFEAPFEHIKEHVLPERLKNRREAYRARWWRHVEPRPALIAKLGGIERYVGTARVAKHRLFVWLSSAVLPDSQIIVIARRDDTTFGVVHSRFHEAWSLRLGTTLEDRPRYTPTTTFETFPFPDGLTPNIAATEYANDPRAIAIAIAAKRLDDLRNAWLNPSDLVLAEPEVVPGYPDRVLPKDTAAAAILRERTLTYLYNERPQWLDDAHRDLDAAVAAAYGWPADISEEDALRELLDLNLARSGTSNIPDVTPFVVEADTFDKISEVEDARLNPSLKRALREVEADELSADARREKLRRRAKHAIQ